jgi:plastocyanin
MRSFPRVAMTVAGAIALYFGAPLAAQNAPHAVVVKMADASGGQFAFQPAAVVAHRGDTLRFVQASSTPHNVAFRKTASGSRLGSASTGPYLLTPGQTYDLVIDNRFTDGDYTFVCDPHEGAGMHGSLTVGASSK